MSTAHILLLGAIAGATIFLGLPVARMQGLGPNARSGLSALATGILVFLFWDVMTNAVDPIETSLNAHHWGTFAKLSVLGAAGFIGGLMSLVSYEGWMKSRADRRSTTLVGPGAAAVDEFVERRRLDLTNPAIRLSFLIAIGIGVHNFAEGLAIGQAAAASEIGLAVTLIIGFGLHNATEGFGICGPLSGAGIVPSWRLLGLLGVIGGAPPFSAPSSGRRGRATPSRSSSSRSRADRSSTWSGSSSRSTADTANRCSFPGSSWRGSCSGLRPHFLSTPPAYRAPQRTLAQASSLGRGIDSIRCGRSVGQRTTRFPDARSASFIPVVDRNDGVACVGTPQDESGCFQQYRGGRSLALSPCGDYETRRERL